MPWIVEKLFHPFTVTEFPDEIQATKYMEGDICPTCRETMATEGIPVLDTDCGADYEFYKKES
jgi:hypothetical protein